MCKLSLRPKVGTHYVVIEMSVSLPLQHQQRQFAVTVYHPVPGIAGYEGIPARISCSDNKKYLFFKCQPPI